MKNLSFITRQLSLESHFSSRRRKNEGLLQYQLYQTHRRRADLKQQFESYYAELRRKIEDEKKPTIH